jgi:hypothetical protein
MPNNTSAVRQIESSPKYGAYRQAESFPIIFFARKVSMIVRNWRAP